MKNLTTLVLCLVWWATVSGALTETSVLAKVPRDLMDRVVKGGVPDEKGMVGFNKSGWQHVTCQRSSMWLLANAAARGDVAKAELGWKAVTAAFTRQTNQGNFDYTTLGGKAVRLGDDVSGVSLWISNLCRAILVIKESSLHERFQQRIQEMLPKIEITMKWLATTQGVLEKYDEAAPNRLLFDAEAFLYSGKLLANDQYLETGRHFLAQGLKLQRDDGVFLEKGGYDSSYQAVALLQLQSIQLRCGIKTFQQAVQKGMTWERQRIQASGEVVTTGNSRTGLGQEQYMGHMKDVNCTEVGLALLYFATIEKDRGAVKQARQVLEYRSKSAGKNKQPDKRRN